MCLYNIMSDIGGGFLTDNPKKLIQLKKMNSINKQILKGIKTISKNKNNITPFGSWIYKSQLYPGDVDLIELEEHCCDLKTALKAFVKDTQKIVKNIMKTRGTYIGDIKAGIDLAFKINIGQLLFDKIGNYKIVGYDATKIREDFTELYDLKIISKKELNDYLKYVPDQIDQLGYEELYEKLREKWLLRWSGDEILQGYKTVSGDRIITLAEAINMPTMTKIDMWQKVNERFLEFSNVLVYYLINENGERTLLNYANDPFDMVNQLKYEVQKYAFSITNYKPFKMVKRMWSIARQNKDYKLIELLTPLMATDLGRLSQITSEIETLILILNNVNSPPMQSILDQIDNFKYRLNNVFELDVGMDSVIKTIDLITKRVKNTKTNRNYIIERLKELKKHFQKIINENTIIQLKKLKLIPIPENYLPPDFVGGCNNPGSPDCPNYNGDGIATKMFQKIANSLRSLSCDKGARKLQDGEIHPGCFNFCGPGTKIELPEVRNYPPYNEIDSICKTHDIEYFDAKNKPNKEQLIRQADNKMLNDLEKHKNDNGYKIAKMAIQGKITAENMFPSLIKNKFSEHFGSS